MGKSPAHTRTLAFLISGLMDCIFGGILLLFWLKLLPVDLTDLLGITRGWAGIVGAVMAVPGVVVVMVQVGKLMEPPEK